jgi:hypothetical protein
MTQLRKAVLTGCLRKEASFATIANPKSCATSQIDKEMLNQTRRARLWAKTRRNERKGEDGDRYSPRG